MPKPLHERFIRPDVELAGIRFCCTHGEAADRFFAGFLDVLDLHVDQGGRQNDEDQQDDEGQLDDQPALKMLEHAVCAPLAH